MKLKLLTVAVATLFTACAADVSSDEVERAEHRAYDDELAVGVSAQALSGIQTIGQVCDDLCSAMAVSSDFAVVIQAPDNKKFTMALPDTQQVATINIGVRMGSIAVAPDGLFYYWDAENGLLKQYAIIGNVKVADTAGEVGGLAVDSTNAYWVDAHGLSKTKRDGKSNPTQLLPAGSISTLFGVDGVNLYFLRMVSPVEYQLRKLNTSTSANTLLRTLTTSAWGASWDGTSIYWIDGPSAGEYRLHRLNKSTLDVATVSRTTKIMTSSAAQAGIVYWNEAPLGGDMALRKRAVDGTVTTERTDHAYMGSLTINGVWLYWLDIKNTGDPVYLKRGIF